MGGGWGAALLLCGPAEKDHREGDPHRDITDDLHGEPGQLLIVPGTQPEHPGGQFINRLQRIIREREEGGRDD